MHTIRITVRNYIAKAEKKVYVCGNSKYNIEFDFDAEWEPFSKKTARFSYNGRHDDVIFTGNTCNIPKILNTDEIRVGVYVGDLLTTTPATIITSESILCDGGVPADPPDDVYNQIMKQLNEIGTPNPEAIAAAVADYIAANPIEEKDPTVPAWAKAVEKPSYTASEVGALPDTYTPPNQTAQQVGADPAGTAASAVSQHNTDATSHNDLRIALQGLSNRINAVLDSDDATLDQMSEVVTYIKSNKSMIDAITTSKVSVADIIDNLTTNEANKPLSAARGVALKAMIDGIAIPDKLPNPNALTFTGAINATYDGSTAVSVEIPSGGSGGTDISLGLTSAAVGQIIKVKAVDESGKPTAWEAADMPSGGGGASYRSWSKVWTLAVAEDIAGFEASNIDLDGKSEIMIVFISDSTTSRTMTNGRLYINGVDAGKVLFNSLPLRKDSHSFVIIGRADDGIEYTTMAAKAEYQTHPWQGDVNVVHRMMRGGTASSVISWIAGSTIKITQGSATLGQGVTIEIYVR